METNYPKIDYYKPTNTPYGILSCDNVRITAEMNKDTKNLLNAFTCSVRPEITIYPPSRKIGSYTHLLTIEYDVDVTATIGIGLNASGRREDECKCMIDFNPNKVAHFDQFWADYRTFRASTCLLEVKRVDLALDIPYPRENVLMCKDKRKYALEMYDYQNKTEYLGRRSNIGYVKVYNKQFESKLPTPLTRIEVTCELDPHSYMSLLPEIYVSGTFQETTEHLNDLGRCHSMTRTLVEMTSAVISLHDNPLPRLNGLRDSQKKRLLELLPLEPLKFPPFKDVCTAINTVKNYLEVS